MFLLDVILQNNGGLFSDEDIEIPPFTDEIRDLLPEKASTGFDWSEISPTIFGAVFESTLNNRNLIFPAIEIPFYRNPFG